MSQREELGKKESPMLILLIFVRIEEQAVKELRWAFSVLLSVSLVNHWCIVNCMLVLLYQS